jgi:hypothetical protein
MIASPEKRGEEGSRFAQSNDQASLKGKVLDAGEWAAE